jgi:replicative DNA helicase
MTALEKLREVSKADPCPICSKPDWCCHLPDGAVVCGRVDIPPDGWQRASAKAKDGRNVFQPIRNQVQPRLGRSLPSWKRTGKHDSAGFEMEIIFEYSDTQRVLRRQWSDRREDYKAKNGKLKNKLVRPQSLNGESWEWSKGGRPWPLYRVDDVRPDDVVFYVGGEICVEAMRKLGFSATCHQGGEGNYLPQIAAELAELRFRMLVIIPDNDDPGQRAGSELLHYCTEAGVLAAILDPLTLCPEAGDKWDVADWDSEPGQKRDALVAAVAMLQPVQHEPPDDVGESAAALRAEVEVYASEHDDFRRAILQRKIGADYGARGSTLNLLEAQVKPKPEIKARPMAEGALEFLDDLERRSQGLVPPGLMCGFTDFDAMTQGFQRTDLVVAAGRPSMGKSSWALAAAEGVARTTGLPCPVFSNEMSTQQVRQRLVAARSGVDLFRLRSGQIQPDEWVKVQEAIDFVFSLNLWIDESKGITPAYVHATCEEIRQKTGQELGLITIDYVNNMNPSIAGTGNLYQDSSRIVRECKDMLGAGDAKVGGRDVAGLNAPCVLVSQLSRGVESRTNKRPQMSDLRETGAIEEAADMICMFYREEYYDPGTVDRGLAELIISKHRNGPTGTVKLLFEGSLARFKNMAA